MANLFTTADLRTILSNRGIDVTIGASYLDGSDATDAVADVLKALDEVQTTHNAQADGVSDSPVASITVGTNLPQTIETPPGSGNLLTGNRVAYSVDTFEVASNVDNYPVYQ